MLGISFLDSQEPNHVNSYILHAICTNTIVSQNLDDNDDGLYTDNTGMRAACVLLVGLYFHLIICTSIKMSIYSLIYSLIYVFIWPVYIPVALYGFASQHGMVPLPHHQ